MRATGLDIRTLPDKIALEEHDDSGFDLTMNCSDIVSNAVIDYYFLVTYDENEDATYTALGSKYETALTISERVSMEMNMKRGDLGLLINKDGLINIMKGTIDMSVTQTTDEYYLFAPAE